MLDNWLLMTKFLGLWLMIISHIILAHFTGKVVRSISILSEGMERSNGCCESASGENVEIKASDQSKLFM